MHAEEQRDKLNLNIADVNNSNNRGRAMGQYFVSMLPAGSAGEKLEKERATFWNDTVNGMEELGYFPESLTSPLSTCSRRKRRTSLWRCSASKVVGITLNSLYIGLDVYIICKVSVGLAYGNKSKVSQLIQGKTFALRARLIAKHARLK